jgi:hypothetical protein
VTSRSRAADERESDDTLVRRACAGDHGALETLLDRHADRVPRGRPVLVLLLPASDRSTVVLLAAQTCRAVSVSDLG